MIVFCLPLKFSMRSEILYLINMKYIQNINIQKDMNNQQDKVLVTGATGYIASHIINQLLKKGYHVVGTVRSLANKPKYQFLLQFPHAKERLQFREADLIQEQHWDKALVGVQSVIHAASPIPPGIPKDENQLIKPAVDGTRNVINACLKNKVKKLLFISSCLTILVRTDGKVPSQQDWSEEKLLHHYPKSKYLAQKLFWQQFEKNKQKMEFISVLPSMVVGPAYSKHGNSSEAFVSQILNGGYPGIPTPSPQYSTIDVRDLAVGVVNALEYPKAAGRRWIVSGDRIKTDEVFNLLRQKYGPQGYKIAENLIDKQGIEKSGHGPLMRTLYLLGKKFQVNNKRSIQELGLTHRPIKQSLIEQAEQQIKLGIVHKP